MKPILVLGLGNPLQGDDGVGCAVAEALAAAALGPLPDEVEVLELGTPGVGLINYLEGRERVVIVDAAEMRRPPADVVRFTPDEIRLGDPTRSFSLHAPGIVDSLLLAKALNMPLAPIVIFGIQPAFIGWRSGLSPEVQAAVPRAVQAVLTEVGDKHGE